MKMLTPTKQCVLNVYIPVLLIFDEVIHLIGTYIV